MGIALFFACLLPCVAVVEVVANRLAIRALMILTGLYLCTHTHTHTHTHTLWRSIWGVCYPCGASVRGT